MFVNDISSKLEILGFLGLNDLLVNVNKLWLFKTST